MVGSANDGLGTLRPATTRFPTKLCRPVARPHSTPLHPPLHSIFAIFRIANKFIELDIWEIVCYLIAFLLGNNIYQLTNSINQLLISFSLNECHISVMNYICRLSRLTAARILLLVNCGTTLIVG